MSETRERGLGGGEPEPNSGTATPRDLPPIPREPNWRLIYSAVIIELALLIIIFYAFTKAFT
jgi:hypothetical protein